MDEKPKRLELSEDDMAKVMRARERHESTKIDSAWLFLAEFGYYFGWGGVCAVRNNEITLQEAESLLIGARKIWAGKVYDHASASFIGSAAAQAKRPAAVFKSATKDLLKKTKAEL